ncbi:MAG: acyl-CoA dehydratase activase [Dehalococcoidia bacterium]|nr:acyl-CoA dehydratase activase [Dehalococcoidia bacterium]
MRAAGIDVGSLSTKAVVLGSDGVVSSAVVLSSDSAESSARAALQQALGGAGLDGDVYVVSTGAGSKSVPFSRQQKAITTCLARGVHYLLPEARTVIDMGAESITVVRINERGRVSDYGNQDKCAAGTGIFLQQMAKLLGLSMEEMATVSSKARARAEITGTCAVFAESEVISHIHRDPPTPLADIVAGIYASMVHRIMAQLQRVGIKREIAVTGGVAANSGLVSILEEAIGHRVLVPEKPELAGAIGAALMARENMAQEVR